MDDLQRHAFVGWPGKCVDIIGMDGEEPHEFVHVLIHRTVEPGKRGQMLPDFDLLLSSLFEEPFGHDELHIAAGDEQLLETVLHPAQALGDKREAGTIKNGFLHASHEAEPEIFTHLADFTQEVQIENQWLISVAPLLVEQLCSLLPRELLPVPTDGTYA